MGKLRASRKAALFFTLWSLYTIIPANAAVDLGNIEVSTIGHSLSASPVPLPGIGTTVTDYLIDQRQDHNGGNTVDGFQGDFDAANQFVLTISAPPGKK